MLKHLVFASCLFLIAISAKAQEYEHPSNRPEVFILTGSNYVTSMPGSFLYNRWIPFLGAGFSIPWNDTIGTEGLIMAHRDVLGIYKGFIEEGNLLSISGDVVVRLQDIHNGRIFAFGGLSLNRHSLIEDSYYANGEYIHRETTLNDLGIDAGIGTKFYLLRHFGLRMELRFSMQADFNTALVVGVIFPL